MGIFSIRWVNERTTKDEPLKFGMNIPKCLPYNLLEVDFRYIDFGNFQVFRSKIVSDSDRVTNADVIFSRVVNLTTFLVVYSNNLVLNIKVSLNQKIFEL